MKTKKTKLLRDAEISALCRDLATLLGAGIPLHEGIAGMGGTDDSGVIEALAKGLAENKRLFETMGEQGCFPEKFVQLVKIGELSGRLEPTLSALSEEYARNSMFKQRLKDALVYPVILIVMMTVVVAVLIRAVLPIFTEVLSQFDSDAASSAASIMNVSTVICTVLLILMLLLLLCAGIGLLLSKTGKGSQLLSKIFNNSLLTRGLARRLAVGNFAMSLSTMLKSGLPVTEAIELSIPAIQCREVAERAAKISADMKAGVPQQKTFADSGLFTPVDCRLLAVAVKSGVLDNAMDQLAEQYSERNTQEIERAVASVEPALIAMLAVIIGAIMLSAMLPLIKIMSSIG